VNDLTQILNAIDAGDSRAAEQLLPFVYDELRKLAASKLAHEKPGQTIDATALVHEAYVRLVDQLAPGNSPGASFANRRHFFAAAAEAMRRILIDNARRKKTQRHGGQMERSDLAPDEIAAPTPQDPLEALAIHEVVDRLAEKSPRKAELVKLRYFLGCTIAQAAEVLGIAPATAEEDWTYAKAWLKREFERDGPSDASI
jgi:RNA polymerase sigma factor (TIGR02999 family)